MNATARDATIVLFGGTGDLASRKLIPALFRLWRGNHLQNAMILGVGRRFSSRDQYVDFLSEHVDVARQEPQTWKEFAELLEFHQGDLATPADFSALRTHLIALEGERHLPGNRLFYYAVGPEWFGPITRGLVEANLLQRPTPGVPGPWSRIVVEKPFGHDLASAKELNTELRQYLDESQIFRIDHYLGKETVQNVLAFRFANGMFEPIWNHNFIESVQLTVAESLGVGGRTDYYEKSGALRDMVQNHMLQLVALTAMEPPISLEADAVRDEKVKVFKALRIPKGTEEVLRSTVRGQYGAGSIDGEKVVAYQQEKGVDPNSRTPTFVAARIFLDTWRWANVPFLLRHGKRLAKRGTEIAIQFKTPPLALFRGTGVCGSCTNLLVIRVQPNEGISLQFGAKIPGAGMQVSAVQMHFEYEESFHQSIPEAYERLILDALLGDQTLFTRSDEVEAMWTWADAILKGWDEMDGGDIYTYPAGSWGPPAAESLFPQGDEVPAGTCPVSWRRW